MIAQQSPGIPVEPPGTTETDAIVAKLDKEGYRVRVVDNYQIGGSLIVYDDDAFKDMAQHLSELVGGIRVLHPSEGYVFKSDILLLVGEDYPFLYSK